MSARGSDPSRRHIGKPAAHARRYGVSDVLQNPMPGDAEYVIECRRPDGTLDFDEPQPEQVFGFEAITGMTWRQMAKIIFARVPTAELYGDRIPWWPSHLDPRWRARIKTW